LSDAQIEIPNSVATTASDSQVGRCTHWVATILLPTNTSVADSP